MSHTPTDPPRTDAARTEHTGPAGATAAPNPDAARHRRTALLGAMFLMATSAIGPGFITQTSTFTVQIGAAFAFATLATFVVAALAEAFYNKIRSTNANAGPRRR